MDPYVVLGVNANASEEEIKKKYRELVKKYHPDKYSGTDMEDLANEKMQQINQAYDTILKTRKEGPQGNSYYRADTRYDNNDIYSQIKRHINQGNIYEAESLLNTLSVKDDKWYFLHGLISWRKGWYDEARNSLQMAVNLNPSNLEYRNALNQLNMSFNGRNSYNQGPYNNQGSGCDGNCCNICTTLWCMDMCCECGGGDFISCC